MDARITSSVEPCGSELSKMGDQRGERADAAPRAVIKPSTSVIRLCDFFVRRAPAAIPSEEPARIAITLTRVPAPTNIV